LRLFALDHGFQQLGDGERLKLVVGLHQDAAIGTHGERGADGFLRRGHPQGCYDDLAGLAGFLQANRFFDRDFVERVHGEFDIGRLDPGPIGLDPDLDVVIDDALDGDQYLHRCFSLKQRGKNSGAGASDQRPVTAVSPAGAG
jgi:hypothetical protein